MSENWKDIDLATLNGPTLAVAADDIMRAAKAEAKAPRVPQGYLMERKTSDGSGHYVHSSMGARASG